jgi:alpha-N-arabinofuranosidase
MYYDGRGADLRAIQGSVSVKDGVLCLTAVNTSPMAETELAVELNGGKLGEVEVVRLAAEDIHAHNTFEHPEAIRLSEPETAKGKGSELRLPMLPGSIIRVMGRLD